MNGHTKKLIKCLLHRHRLFLTPTKCMLKHHWKWELVVNKPLMAIMFWSLFFSSVLHFGLYSFRFNSFDFGCLWSFAYIPQLNSTSKCFKEAKKKLKFSMAMPEMAHYRSQEQSESTCAVACAAHYENFMWL